MKTLYASILFLLSSSFQSGALKSSKKDVGFIEAAFYETVLADVADFLISISESNLVALKEGEAAIERGTVADIKSYGELMVKDQTQLLSEIRDLAEAREINLPEHLSQDYADELEDLKSKSGVAFNKAFVKMIEEVQKQTMKDFQKATDRLEDKEIVTFASRHIHSTKLQLLRLQKIKAKM